MSTNKVCSSFSSFNLYSIVHFSASTHIRKWPTSVCSTLKVHPFIFTSFPASFRLRIRMIFHLHYYHPTFLFHNLHPFKILVGIKTTFEFTDTNSKKSSQAAPNAFRKLSAVNPFGTFHSSKKNKLHNRTSFKWFKRCLSLFGGIFVQFPKTSCGPLISTNAKT